ncbi:DUF4097 family beta strand repeat-containing protein [Shewanella sp. Isolate11]|uniref:DUF4097 family beta strand repeat-containing protein n=1 Tax=Shewanella sp. Isolate11 TaxID=2908530 RepID=UPI001EFE7D5D|nr:DUF4097 family beta strand repeat-containing protein [Shewanella sp. Isolate11]MCG9697750.1 DUF4097 domain-containing protein [Shewanella sp. Isolate11]
MNLYHKLAIIPLLLLSQFALAAEQVDKTISSPDNLRLKVTVQRGEVKLLPWDKSEIQVSGTLDELSQGLNLMQNGNAVILEDKMPRSYSGNNSQGSDLTIMVPKSLKLYAEGVSANYQLRGLQGDINIQSVSGEIKASTLVDNVTIHTVSGDINTEALKGKLELESVSGSIQDNHSIGSVSYKLVSGNLTANSHAKEVAIEVVSGDAKIELNEVSSLKGQSVSGDLDVSLNRLTSKINLDSVSGDIELTLPADLNANININGGPGGDINNNLTSDKPKKGKYSPTSSLQFQMGNGSAEVNLGTISGEIELKKIK